MVTDQNKSKTHLKKDAKHRSGKEISIAVKKKCGYIDSVGWLAVLMIDASC